MAPFKFIDAIYRYAQCPLKHDTLFMSCRNQPIEKYGDGSTSRDYTFISDIVDVMFSLPKKNLILK